MDYIVNLTDGTSVIVEGVADIRRNFGNEFYFTDKDGNDVAFFRGKDVKRYIKDKPPELIRMEADLEAIRNSPYYTDNGEDDEDYGSFLGKVNEVKNTLIWHFRQLLPLTYRTKYVMSGKEHFVVWKMWFGRCYDIDDYVIGEESPKI